MHPTSWSTKLLRTIFGLMLTLAITALTRAQTMPIEPVPVVDLNQHGLTGSWYRQATSGQGVQLEVYPNAIAPGIAFIQGSWFTFGYVSPGFYAAGGGYLCGYWDYDCEYPAPQRWYTFSGSAAAGDSRATLTLYSNLGGNFNAPPATRATTVGTVTLSFKDCATATMEYSFTDGTAVAGTIPLVRLTPNVTCSSSDGGLVDADFAHSGNWFDPAINGQGFVFELNPNARVLFLTWYTYEAYGEFKRELGQHWYTGQANYVPGTRTIPVTLYRTTGGLFESDLAVARTAVVGAATVTFLSCESATLTFNFPGGSDSWRSGAINLSRVGPVPADCG